MSIRWSRAPVRSGAVIIAGRGNRPWLHRALDFWPSLSTYKYLKRIDNRELIAITFRTIASEIRNHKWELRNPTYRPVMEKLAALMEEAARLNRAGEFKQVDAKVAAYRHLFARNVENLK